MKCIRMEVLLVEYLSSVMKLIAVALAGLKMEKITINMTEFSMESAQSRKKNHATNQCHLLSEIHYILDRYIDLMQSPAFSPKNYHILLYQSIH